MIKFKLGNKTVNVASTWEDLTFRQFLKVLTLKNDIIEAISICSGIEYAVLKEAGVIVGLESLISAVQFLNTPAKYPDTTDRIGPYKFPLDSKGEYNPQLQRLDQFEDMRKAMVFNDKGIVAVTEAYATYCAIYLQSIRDGYYSFDKAKGMIEEVKDMPAKEVIPAGSFFLIKLLSLTNGIKPISQTTSQSRKKSKPALKNSKKRSVSMRPSRKSRKR